MARVVLACLVGDELVSHCPGWDQAASSWRNTSTSLRNLSFSQPESALSGFLLIFSLAMSFRIFSVKLKVSLKLYKALQTSFTFVYLTSSLMSSGLGRRPLT